MLRYHFRPGSLQTDQHGVATLVLPSDDGDELCVRLCPTDAQMLATALVGVATPALRMAQLVARLAGQLDARPSQLRLSRGTGNLITATLVLARELDLVELPVTFGDGVLLALADKLPIAGDASLAPLVRTRSQTEQLAPPAPFAAFLRALSEEG